MTILDPAGLNASGPFCDSLDMTFPRECAADVDGALLPFLVEADATSTKPGLWRVPRYCLTVDEVERAGKLKVPTVTTESFGQVHRVSFSGGSCASFRARGLWDQVLAHLWEFPHRLTRLDATLDLDVDAPPLLERLVSAGRAGGVRLGRKQVDPMHVQEQMALDARGVRTGTVWLGKPSREIRFKAYDKRHELEGWGCPDPGPWLRSELTLRNVGATMRDAACPAAIFWNYARDIVRPPADAPSWSAGDTGYALPPRGEVDVWRVLQRRVDEWNELRQLGALSDRLGPYGRFLLVGLIQKALGVWGRSPRGSEAELALSAL